MTNITDKKLNEMLVEALEDVEAQFQTYNYSRDPKSSAAVVLMDIQKVRDALALARSAEETK